MLSMPHLIVLFVVALVIFGPQKLPELARMLGKATAEFRKMTGDFRYALEEEVRELERQTRIREAEAAAAAARPQSVPVETVPVEPAVVEPEGSVPRAASSSEGAMPTEHASELRTSFETFSVTTSHETLSANVATEPSVEPSVHGNPEPPAVAPDSATRPHEKNPDDNAAA
jgi:TatA/E family protein of Tat protein translocase